LHLSHQERLNIAVFIDFDNIEIGVKSTLGEHFDVGAVLEAIKERGEVVTKIAYADWTRASEYSRHLTQHAIRLVQRNLTPGGDKNGADINLALDALEMVFTHEHINAYVIVGGDSDFLSLVEKLKQYDKKVFVVGGRAFTSVILQRNCHEFVAYENLTRGRRSSARGDRALPVAAVAPISQAFPIVRRALKILSDREVSPQTGLLKSTLLQLDSTFSERNYGASSFLDFAEKLAQAGLVQLKHSGRSVIVELNGAFSGDGETVEPQPEAAQPRLPEAAQPRLPEPGQPRLPEAGHQRPPEAAAGDAAAPPLGTSAEGIQVAGQIFRSATNARWPMYIRNVKQLLRAYRGDETGNGASAGFDERRYGFGGLMEFLRACQRDGLLRVERDRRGGLRVFPGSALQVRPEAPTTVTAAVNELPVDVEPEAMESGQPMPEVDVETIPIDTTAELLGRAKPKRTRGRTATPTVSGLRGARKAARKTTPRKTRSRKSAPQSKTSGEPEET
jgi:uncharacterized LabA/DUF88 family protein